MSAAETRSIDPTTRTTGGATRSAAIIARTAITHSRMATDNWSRGREPVRPAAMHRTPRLNSGIASKRFHQSSSAAKGSMSRRNPGARNRASAATARYTPCQNRVCPLENGGACTARNPIGSRCWGRFYMQDQESAVNLSGSPLAPVLVAAPLADSRGPSRAYAHVALPRRAIASGRPGPSAKVSCKPSR